MSDTTNPASGPPDTTSPAASASPEPAAASAPTEKPKSSSGMKLKVVALSAALCGMVIGAVVEMFVQGALESTGWFGATIDTVIEEQLANFNSIQEKLAAIEAATTEADRARLTDELEALLKEQEKLTSRTHEELRASAEQIESLRARALQEQGAAGGVDFWLAPGESVSVGSRGNVFAVTYVRPTFIGVNMSGTLSQMKPGDFVEAKVGDEVYKVFFKSTPRESDPKRVGFDIVRPGE